MPYKYVAYDVKRNLVKGTVPVSTESLAVDTLVKSGLKILSLREVKPRGLSRLPSLVFSVKPSDVVLFSRQLAMLLERGTGFLTALRLSRQQVASSRLKKVLAGTISAIEAGGTFSSALDRHPDTFPFAYRRMIQVGEQTGKLEEVLFEVAAYMERDEDTRKKVRSIMVYPSFILILAVVTAFVLTTVVLPPLVNMFATFNAQLPWTTRALLAVSDFLGDYVYYIISIGFLLVVLAIWYLRRPGGHYYLEKILWKLPFVRRISMLRSMHNFCRIMSILLASGLPMMDVIRIAEQSARSQTLRRSLTKLPDRLLSGKSLSQAMKADSLFPGVLAQMVLLGESTNSLDNSFATMADQYEFEFNQSVRTLTALLEPALMLIVGLGIALVAVSIIMPIYSIYSFI
ncbi:type II secretion system F family protein [Chloroflexota bacterium]